mmetsp:Transcript_35167/g.48783  ORF Transcript_35167/g.48783 Transcript_35167/m.48783 type:complete len:1016 (-) Transcript_35167:135-3182(-)
MKYITDLSCRNVYNIGGSVHLMSSSVLKRVGVRSIHRVSRGHLLKLGFNAISVSRKADPKSKNRYNLSCSRIGTITIVNSASDVDKLDTSESSPVAGKTNNNSKFSRTIVRRKPKRVDTLQISKDGFHVHFGAGRLGMGLVLPALQGSGVPFVILQRPSREWSELAEAEYKDRVKISINGEKVDSLVLVTEANGLDIPQADDPEIREHGAVGFIVLSKEEEVWSKLIAQATSFSCAVGSPTWLAPYLQQLPQTRRELRPTLFACENNHRAVRELKAQLHGQVKVVSCMVDRICAERTVCSSGAIAIEAENHLGSIVMLEAPKKGETAKMPLEGDNVLVPQNSEIAEYLYMRKLLTVNGMHTTLAFMTLSENYEKLKKETLKALSEQGPEALSNSIEEDEDDVEEEVEEVEEIPDLPLLSTATASEQNNKDLRAWAVAQLLTLMAQFDLDLMLEAHETEDELKLFDELLQIAFDNLDRFQTVEDTTGRVLGGGIAARFEGRLMNVFDEVDKLDSSKNTPQRRLAARAGLDLDDIQIACYNLTKRSEKFAELDIAQREAAEVDEKGWSMLPSGMGEKIQDAFEDTMFTAMEFGQEIKDDFLTPMGDALTDSVDMITSSLDPEALFSLTSSIDTEGLQNFADDVSEAFGSLVSSLDGEAVNGMLSEEEMAEFNMDPTSAVILQSVSAAAIGGPVPPEVLAACGNVAVLFDFDGTLGDTETPAMEVAFWELAPYLPEMTADMMTEAVKNDFIRENAGKAFEFMVDKVNKDRASLGMSSLEESKASKDEDPAVLALVDTYRAKFGLATFERMRADGSEPTDILIMQKDETVEALKTLAQACKGVVPTLEVLNGLGVRYAIATTSGKPRVPVSVVAAELEAYFPPNKIHSGESDFNPPKFKPDPAVYLLAASSENCDVANAVAVEDSASGVGSASNAGIGLIVGYMGASHVSEDRYESYAEMLMSGTRADNGRGAEIVVLDMTDLVTLVKFFAMERAAGRSRPFTFSDELLQSLNGKYWLK